MRVHLWLVIVMKGEGGVDLGQGEMGVLKMDLLRAPSVCDHVQGDLEDLSVGPVDPRHAPVVDLDVSGR